MSGFHESIRFATFIAFGPPSGPSPTAARTTGPAAGPLTLAKLLPLPGGTATPLAKLTVMVGPCSVLRSRISATTLRWYVPSLKKRAVGRTKLMMGPRRPSAGTARRSDHSGCRGSRPGCCTRGAVPLTVVRETVTVRSPLTVSPSVGEVKQSSIVYAAEGGLLVAQFPAASAGAGCTRGIGSAPTVSANATTTASALRVADRHADRVLCIDMALKLCNEDGTPHWPVRPAP